MKTFIVGAVAALAFAGCSAEHAQNELNKDKARAEATGQWAGPCDTTSFVSAAAGIKSSRTVYDFYNNTGRTVQLFGDDACKNQLAQATYSGTAVIGQTTSFDSAAQILDLNYTDVSIAVSDAGLANFLNNPLTPGCGINDWQPNGQARDVKAHAGDLNCPYVSAPYQSFDVIKTDGQQLHFGKNDGPAHDKTSADKRPMAIDNDVTYTKQ